MNQQLPVFSAGCHLLGGGRGGNGAPQYLTDAALATSLAFVQSELERADPLLREPLTAVTYDMDIPMQFGGGWVEFLTAVNIQYAVSGGVQGAAIAPGANVIPRVQINNGKDVFGAHTFEMTSVIRYADLQRGQITGRPIDMMHRDGINLTYRKHMDMNCYLGMAQYGTTGLLNSSAVVAQYVPSTGTGSGTAPRLWVNKTPQQIVADITGALTYTWQQSGNDRSALPNHVTMDYNSLNYILTQPMVIGTTPIALTIAQYILDNNITKTYSGGKENIVFNANSFSDGAGAGNTCRMAIYRHDERFLYACEFVPLARTITQPSVREAGYESLYQAHISALALWYPQTVSYWDGFAAAY